MPVKQHNRGPDQATPSEWQHNELINGYLDGMLRMMTPYLVPGTINNAHIFALPG